MSLAQVSLLFLLQIGWGSLLTFVVNDRRALGPKYYKFAGWVLLAVYGLAGSLVWSAGFSGAAGWAERTVAACVAFTAVALLLFASVSGWGKPALESLLLWCAVLGGAAAVVFSINLAPVAQPTHGERALLLASAVGSSLVLGFTTWGMILGHWYLVSQGLPVAHLRRLVAPLPWMLLAKAAVSGLALALLWPRFLGPGNASLGELMQRQPDRVLDVVNVWARIPVGLLVPAVLAGMTLVTVRMERTQPATGILYAMCVLVYLGELFGQMVLGSTGVPL
jgi:hypothetical protein